MMCESRKRSCSGNGMHVRRNGTTERLTLSDSSGWALNPRWNYHKFHECHNSILNRSCGAVLESV